MKNLNELIQTIKDELGYPYDLLRPVTREGLGSDMHYRAKVHNVTEARQFNYHSDYWGYDGEYKDQNITAVKGLRGCFGKIVQYNGEAVRLVAMLIDKQYNSIGHTALLIERIEN